MDDTGENLTHNGTPYVEVVTARPITCSFPPAPGPPPDPRTLPQLTRRQAALDLALVVTVGLVVPGGFELAARLSADEPSLALAEFSGLIVVHQWFGALLAIALAAYLVYRHELSAAALGLQAERLGRQFVWGALTLGVVYGVLGAVALVAMMLSSLLPGIEEDIAQRKEFLDLFPVDNVALTLLLMLPVAIHEEVLFRGLLLPYLRRVGLSWTGAVLVSTGIFAVLHLDQGWTGIGQVFVIGVVLAVCFLRSRSLLAVVLAHFAFNVVQIQVVVRYVVPVLDRLSEAG